MLVAATDATRRVNVTRPSTLGGGYVNCASLPERKLVFRHPVLVWSAEEGTKLEKATAVSRSASACMSRSASLRIATAIVSREMLARLENIATHIIAVRHNVTITSTKVNPLRDLLVFIV